MDRGRAGAVVIGPAAFALAALAQAGGGYVWHVSTPGEIVEYGVPGTDQRALRVECRAGRGLRIVGPASEALPENMPTRVTFRRGENQVSMLGVTMAMGDGLAFTVPVTGGELPIAALVAGEPLTIVHGDATWTVPEGAAALVGPLVAACPVSRR